MIRNKPIYYLLITFIVFFSLGKTVYGKSYIPKYFFNDCIINSIIYIKKWERNKLKLRVFDMEKIFNGIVKQIQILDQGRYAINNNTRHHNSKLLDWDVEIKNKIYHIYVNRSKKTVTIGGEAEDWKEKEKVEDIIELRAPDNFEIINKIEITNKGLG